MVQAVPATEVTLRQLKQKFHLEKVQTPVYFAEAANVPSLADEGDLRLLDRVKSNFLELMEDPPMLENSVKMVVLAPLLDLSGFYQKPFRIETETSVKIEMQDEGVLIRGRIDVLVLQRQLWMLVIESKRSDFAVTRAIPQALSYMLANPVLTDRESNRPTFGMITNGNEFLFLKVARQDAVAQSLQYANSRLFSLINPQNELYEVLSLMRQLGQQAITV